MTITLTALGQASAKFLLNQAKSTSVDYLKRWFSKITDTDLSVYEQKLSLVIEQTMLNYKNDFPPEDTNKIAFYQSQTLLDELLKFRLTGSIDKTDLLNSIKKDERIKVPQISEIERFIDYFDEELKKNGDVQQLFIDCNYKSEIFNLRGTLEEISQEVNALTIEFTRLQEGLKASFNTQLSNEWSKQIDQSKDYLFKFKPKTALDLLATLENRINENGGFHDKLMLARMTYLKAFCKNEIKNRDERGTAERLFINAYKLNPYNSDYKHAAALSYYVLSEHTEAKRLGEEMITDDPFNPTGWILRCYYSSDSLQDFMASVPMVVKSNLLFKINVFNRALSTAVEVSISEIDDMQLGFDNEVDLPQTLSIVNREYWSCAFHYFFGKFNENSKMARAVSLLDETQKTSTLAKCNKILKLVHDSLTATEIENNFLVYFFLYYHTEYLLRGDVKCIGKMECYYDKVNENNPQAVFAMAKAFASTNQKTDLKRAILCIDDYEHTRVEKNKDLALLKAIYQVWLKDENGAIASYEQYMNSTNCVTEQELFNFLRFACHNKNIRHTFSEGFLPSLLQKKFSPLTLKRLPELLLMKEITDVYPKIEIETVLKNVSNDLEADSPLRYFVALAYYSSGMKEKSIEYMRGYVSFDMASPDLKLYCEAIFETDAQDKLALLPILEKWRTKFSFADYNLTQLEIYLKESQNRWLEALKIAEFSYETFDDDNSLIQVLTCAVKSGLKEKVNQYSAIASTRELNNEDATLHMVGAIFQAGLHEVALEILYKNSINNEHIKTREAYFHLIVDYSGNFFTTYNRVEVDRYVTYSLENKVSTIFISREKATEPRYSAFLGKLPSDIVKIKQPLSNASVEAKIIRITDKYLSLFDEIMAELDNPLKGYQIQVVKFDNNNISSINKSFIEQFGVESNLHIEEGKELLEEYKKGNISFSEVTCNVFRHSPFEGYKYLTNSSLCFFRSIPSIVFKAPEVEKPVYVLDPTSLSLFFELSEGGTVAFQEKFTVTTFIREEVQTVIEKIKSGEKSEMSLTITKDNVIPHLKHQDEDRIRIDYFLRLQEWIEKNCDEINVDERINFISGTDNTINQRFLNIQIDCRLLADRPNYFLISNDSFFSKHLHTPQQKLLSPEAFLDMRYSQLSNAIKQHYLSKGYIGFTLSGDIIATEYFLWQGKKNNKFQTCLDNLDWRWNPSQQNITASVQFLKQLFLSNSISQVKKQTSQHVLVHLLRGMDYGNLKYTTSVIESEFSLMGLAKDALQIEFINALTILQINKTGLWGN